MKLIFGGTRCNSQNLLFEVLAILGKKIIEFQQKKSVSSGVATGGAGGARPPKRNDQKGHSFPNR